MKAASLLLALLVVVGCVTPRAQTTNPESALGDPRGPGSVKANEQLPEDFGALGWTWTLPADFRGLPPDGEGVLSLARGPDGTLLRLLRWSGDRAELQAMHEADPLTWSAANLDAGIDAWVSTRPGDVHGAFLELSWYFAGEAGSVEVRAALPREGFEVALQRIRDLLERRPPSGWGRR